MFKLLFRSFSDHSMPATFRRDAGPGADLAARRQGRASPSASGGDAPPPQPLPVCACGSPLFRENTVCLNCGATVGFVPGGGWLLSFREEPAASAPENTESGSAESRNFSPDPAVPALGNRRFKFCSGRHAPPVCNWMIDAADSATQCLSCSLTRTSPDLSQPGADVRWGEAERAKRQSVSQLLRLGLPVKSKLTDPSGVMFDFLEPLPGGPPVMTGHEDGLITLNLAEADPAQRALFQEQMGERYRTLTGHLRHELAHYYWQLFSGQYPGWLEEFRQLFGDETADYGQALARHHSQGPPADWPQYFISAYASSHPWEDWAETFAHYLHMEEALHTADRLGLDPGVLHLRTDSFDRKALLGITPPAPDGTPHGPAADPGFLRTIDRWVRLSIAANELNASLGHPFAYPFVLSAPAVVKLHFIRLTVSRFALPV